MSQPSIQLFNPPFDPTGYLSITGAQLLQYITGLTTLADKGLFIPTTDIALVATVPDANTTTEWQSYGWIRRQTSAVSLYLWNPTAADNIDPNTSQNLLKWYSITSASIPDGSITNAKLANNAVTDAKVNDVSFGKITGVPTYIQSGAAAGGSLAGNYPNPTLAAGVVGTANIANGAVGTNQLAVGAVTLSNVSLAGSSALQMIRVNAGNTALESFTQVITQIAAPSAGDALKKVRVNAAGNGFESVFIGTLQTVVKKVTSGTTSTVIPYDNTEPQVGEGAEAASVSITPISATSLLRFKFGAWLDNNGSTTITLALFTSASVSAIQAVTTTINSTCAYLEVDAVIASPGTSAITVSVRYGGSAGDTSFNADSAGAKYGTAANSYLIATEFVGTLS